MTWFKLLSPREKLLGIFLLGAISFPKGLESGRELLREAFDLGITHFDTFKLYGAVKHGSIYFAFRKIQHSL
jgi:aryl-alcohol dehydrogenase-like predicted oxidoreductase